MACEEASWNDFRFKPEKLALKRELPKFRCADAPSVDENFRQQTIEEPEETNFQGLEHVRERSRAG